PQLELGAAVLAAAAPERAHPLLRPHRAALLVVLGNVGRGDGGHAGRLGGGVARRVDRLHGFGLRADGVPAHHFFSFAGLRAARRVSGSVATLVTWASRSGSGAAIASAMVGSGAGGSAA